MPFDHERLEVYRFALDFFDLADDLVERLRDRGGRANLADQLSRASLSIVNNIAEGPGKFKKPDKSRFYTVAMGPVTESAAMLDVCLRRKLIAPELHQHGKHCSIASPPCSSSSAAPCKTAAVSHPHPHPHPNPNRDASSSPGAGAEA